MGPGDHRILCGDATEDSDVRKLMRRKQAAMVITEPPYNVQISSVQGRGQIRHRPFVKASGELSRPEFTEFLGRFLRLVAEYSADGAIVYVFMDWRHSVEIATAGEAVFGKPKNLIVWIKTNAGQGTFYRSQHELIFVFKNGDVPHVNNFELGQHGRSRSNVWAYAGVNTFRAGRLDELAMLVGRLFDDRGNRMTPSHTNKRGARYRYYVSHAVLQKRRNEAGSVTRVPAHEVETSLLAAVRNQLEKNGADQSASSWSDRELVDRCIERITTKDGLIEIRLLNTTKHNTDKAPGKSQRSKSRKRKALSVITVPWTAMLSQTHKGIVHSPSHKSMMSEENRDALLTAIAKAGAFVEDLTEGRVASFAEIAKKEGKVERHIRLLSQLAFVAPRIVQAINSAAVSGLKVTQLAKAAAPSWERHQARMGISDRAD